MLIVITKLTLIKIYQVTLRPCEANVLSVWSPVVFALSRNKKVCLVNKKYTNIIHETSVTWALKILRCCYIQLFPHKNAAADLGFNFKGCATSGKAASINGTRGLGGVLSPRSQCIQSYLQPKTRSKWQRQLSSARFA